jgi:hypothetical protein
VYGEIVYRGLYPGIDLTYAGAGQRLKSEFRVSPGAEPGEICLRYDGVERLEIDVSGTLVAHTPAGDLREDPPFVYQETANGRARIDAAYRLDHHGAVRFTLGAYDHHRPLVIDPVISFSTLLGGAGLDSVTAVAIDASRNIYIAGWTDSSDFPNQNALRPRIAGGADAFVAKLTPSGDRLVYCTYLGGSGDDRAYGIAVDKAGAVYVTGYTASQAFPPAAPFQASLAGGRDAFLAKLDPAGDALIYRTYFGGGGYMRPMRLPSIAPGTLTWLVKRIPATCPC